MLRDDNISYFLGDNWSRMKPHSIAEQSTYGYGPGLQNRLDLTKGAIQEENTSSHVGQNLVHPQIEMTRFAAGRNFRAKFLVVTCFQ
jgi:hypothetical protein